uniref:Uncharacterized protein n=1 Tax=Arundo donax TaxID=35708 RepID=A0A0A9B278_ARUDO
MSLVFPCSIAEETVPLPPQLSPLQATASPKSTQGRLQRASWPNPIGRHRLPHLGPEPRASSSPMPAGAPSTAATVA